MTGLLSLLDPLLKSSSLEPLESCLLDPLLESSLDHPWSFLVRVSLSLVGSNNRLIRGQWKCHKNVTIHKQFHYLSAVYGHFGNFFVNVRIYVCTYTK
jgi:hypothetical protein